MYIADPTNTGDGGISTGWSSAPRTDCHPALRSSRRQVDARAFTAIGPNLTGQPQ
jgi:hypothetical protein